MADDEFFDAFPLAAKGNYFEDFSVNQSFQHHWGRTVTEYDNVLFSSALCAWHPLFLNAEYAKANGHGDVLINPMLVLCIVIGLSVEDLSEVGGTFLGMNECRFHKAVYAGDTLTASSEVVDKRLSESRPDFGIVKWRTKAFDQRDELVIDFERSNLVGFRNAETAE
jgi:itaconyl-CoA hydratase